MNGRWTSKVFGAVAGLALTLPATLLTSASAVATTPPAAPVDVVVTEVGWQQVTVQWEHGSSGTPWMYRIDNLTTGDVWTASGTSTSSQVRNLEPEQTYRLQLRAIDVYSSSEPVEVTVTTAAMPHVDPPSGLEVVDVEWNGADLAWKPSQDDDLWRYEVVDLDSDRITAVVGADTTSAHLKLLPERTYRFVVQAARVPVEARIRYRFPTLQGFAVSEPSNSAVVDGPPSGDTTPPVPPDRVRVIVDCRDGDESYESLGASDDTSPLVAIQYQAIRFDIRTGRLFVDPAGYDIPRTGSLQSPLIGPDNRIRLRAVDEAGNRSETVELLRGEEESESC